MRLSGLDHLRGFGIILVLLFSVSQWMYYPVPEFELFRHNRPGEFHAGDLVFPLFLFASGVSLHFLSCKLREKRLPFAHGLEKFAVLFFVSLIISSSRIFTPFPDEVMMIAACGLLAFFLTWFFSRTQLLIYSAAALLSVQVLGASQSVYLGGIASIPYYSLLVLAGAQVARDAFPQGAFLAKHSFPALSRWLFSLLALSLLAIFAWPIDKMSLSVSFLLLSAALSAALFSLFVYLFDALGLYSRFLSTIGAHSLFGWALYFFFTAPIWYLSLRGSFSYELYYPAIALLLLLLYAALLLGERFVWKKGKEKK